MARDKAEQERKPRAPRIKGADIVGSSELGRQIAHFCKEFTRDQFFKIAEDAKKAPGQKKLKVPPGTFGKAAVNEGTVMEALGWYWEPLLHDIAFLEQMRDAIPLLSGAYQKFVDAVMDGFAFQHQDPEVVKKFNDLLIYSPVDFEEVMRASALDLATIANTYRKPIYSREGGKLSVVTLKPIRSVAIRKLRDDNLVTQGYVQLLHRPSEFIFGATPATPTVLLADEVLCGWAFSKDWYAYGVPPIASLPFMTKMKLQMERDLAELLHQHVPRIDITYTPEDQMNQDQVDDAVADLKGQVAGLSPTDNFVHTPDTTVDYKGPLGKALDFSSPMGGVEDQFFAVLPLGPAIMGRAISINPMLAQQVWRFMALLINRLRRRLYIMYYPMLKKMADEMGAGDPPTFQFSNLDPETAEQMARTDEYHIQNASASRDAGFIDQDRAARDATRNHPDGPVKKAAAPGQLSPPVDPNKNLPNGNGGGSGKVGDANKGPKGPNRSAPTPDKRPKGKRHEMALPEMFEEMFQRFNERLGITREQFFGDEWTEEEAAPVVTVEEDE